MSTTATSWTQASADAFYVEIEEGVREFVRSLRNAGINTRCSCHHDGYIQAESIDPSTEQLRIYNVMREMGVKNWEATLRVEYTSTYYFHSWEIRSEAFKFVPPSGAPR